MSATTISALRDDCAATHPNGWAYHQRMIHRVPDAPVVDRLTFILDWCRDKRVINFGSASGGLHQAIRRVATSVVGVDREPPCDHMLDFDHLGPVTSVLEGDVMVCGETLEHLSNPGLFLEYLRRLNIPLLVTVPNAFSENARHQMQKGIEAVNSEHVCWYSYHTLRVLLERHRFTVTAWAYYHGRPRFAEGLIMVTV